MVVLLALISSSSAAAATITIGAIDTGWYATWGRGGGTGVQNYITGGNAGPFGETRSFFVFDLLGIDAPIVSATLRLYNPSSAVSGDSGNGYASVDATEVMALHSVETSIAALMGATGGSGTFDDLADGTLYASRTVSAADDGTLVSFDLNQNALSDLNAASGLFAFGGSLTTLGSGDESMFAYTGGPLNHSFVSNITRELVIETSPLPVPEPASIFLFGAGVIAFVGQTLRRRA